MEAYGKVIMEGQPSIQFLMITVKPSEPVEMYPSSPDNNIWVGTGETGLEIAFPLAMAYIKRLMVERTDKKFV